MKVHIEAVKSFIKTFIHIFTLGLYDPPKRSVTADFSALKLELSKPNGHIEVYQWTEEEIVEIDKGWDGVVKFNRIPTSVKDF